MNNSTVISVILPVYNCSLYLTAAINSILCQTFTNFELIIINDGSTDRSLEIIKQFERIDKRIKVISRENKGFSHSLNEGIAIAKGRFIARMDADDISLPERFEKQIRWLEENDADICGGAVRLIDIYDKPIQNGICYYPLSSEAVKVATLFLSPFAHPAVIFRKDIVTDNKYDGSFFPAEDYELWSRLIMDGAKAGNLPEVILNYRVHPHQLTNTRAQQMYDCRTNIARIYWQYFFNSCDSGMECLIDRRIAVKSEDIGPALSLLNSLRFLCNESFIINICEEQLRMLLIRATGIGLPQMLKILKKLELPVADKIFFAFLSFIYAGKFFITLRNNDFLRSLFLKWLKRVI